MCDVDAPSAKRVGVWGSLGRADGVWSSVVSFFVGVWSKILSREQFLNLSIAEHRKQLKFTGRNIQILSVGAIVVGL